MVLVWLLPAMGDRAWPSLHFDTWKQVDTTSLHTVMLCVAVLLQVGKPARSPASVVDA